MVFAFMHICQCGLMFARARHTLQNRIFAYLRNFMLCVRVCTQTDQSDGVVRDEYVIKHAKHRPNESMNVVDSHKFWSPISDRYSVVAVIC